MLHKKLTNVDGTISKIFLDNRDYLLNESKSAIEIQIKISKLFKDNKISTPKSRLIEFKLLGMSFNQALMYVQNIIFAGDKMNVF